MHTDGDKFCHLPCDSYVEDVAEYDMPEEVVLQLSHKDVYLGFFVNKKREILALRSGDPLVYRDMMLYDSSTQRPVAQLSKRMQKSLAEWEARGYRVASAEVRFVVAWKPKEAPKGASESAVMLADMVLKKVSGR